MDFFRPPHAPGETSATQGRRYPPVLVPIRALAATHRSRIAQHLLALDPQDRYLRFGYAAGDEQIARYVDGLNFDRDEIYGVYNRKLELIAMAHLSFADNAQCTSCAEFGVSVHKAARGKGLGTRLFDRAIMHARNEGVDMMFIHALTENTAMLKIAHSAGAWVERDGSETQAYVKLPPATLDTRMTEVVQDQVAEVDFQLKLQAKRFWQFLGSLQAVRHGVQNGRHPSDE